VAAQAVLALVRDEGQLWAYGQGWQAGPFAHAVLYLGAPPSYDPYRLAGAAGYVCDPYPLRQSLAEVPEQSSTPPSTGSALTRTRPPMPTPSTPAHWPLSR